MPLSENNIEINITINYPITYKSVDVTDKNTTQFKFYCTEEKIANACIVAYSSVANAVLLLLLTSLSKKDPDLIGVINFKKCLLCHRQI